MKTIKIGGKEYPIAGYSSECILEDGTVLNDIPIADIPMMSDYKWQLNCLNDRLEHPEKYSKTENVEETIKKLKQWLAAHEPVGMSL